MIWHILVSEQLERQRAMGQKLNVEQAVKRVATQQHDPASTKDIGTLESQIEKGWKAFGGLTRFRQDRGEE